MRRVFISDLHLEDHLDERFARFAELLAKESAWADEIYILGDLVEMWIGDDDDSELAEALTDTLRRTSQATEVFLLHGNRDFLFGDAFAERCGATLIADPHKTEDGVLLSHGDALCTDDAEYMQLRAMFRSEAWQADILGRSLAERKALGDGLRAQSKAANANKPTNIMDVNPGALRELLQLNAAERIVHGHTHRPEIKRSASEMRLVLGAWERCGWLGRQKDDRFDLECFSLARHYGT